MGTILDLIGSMIFGGALLMIILSAHDAARENQQIYANDMIVQQSLVGVARMLEGELRNMGSGVPKADSTIIKFAGNTKITFCEDTDRDGRPDTLTYWVGPTTELLDTQNEMDRKLYRKWVKGDGSGETTTDIVALVTQFNLEYQNLYKDSITTASLTGNSLKYINTIVVTVEVQSPFAPYRVRGTVQSGQRDAWYSSSLWQQTRLVSMNFRR